MSRGLGRARQADRVVAAQRVRVERAGDLLVRHGFRSVYLAPFRVVGRTSGQACGAEGAARDLVEAAPPDDLDDK